MNNKTKQVARVMAWQKAQKKTPEGRRRIESWRIKTRYGISIDERDSLLTLQGNRCAICLTAISFPSAAIDHDHVTGRVRGILCHSCNMALGLFKDNSVNLLSALKYIDQTKTEGVD